MKKKKDLGLLKKVRKQERLRSDFWFWKLFWESWELFSARHEHSISVPDSTSLNHCITDKTLQHLFILILDFFILNTTPWDQRVPVSGKCS